MNPCLASKGVTSFSLSGSNSSYQILLILNLLLPLAVTILRGFFASLDPMGKYAILKMAAVRIESEIYQYRTKVGRYNTRKMTSSQQQSNSSNSNSKKKDDKDNENHVQYNPRKIFSQALDNIWSEISSDMASGVLLSPPDHSDPLDAVNKRILSNVKEQNMLTTTLKQPQKEDGKPGKSFAAYFTRSAKGTTDQDLAINMSDIYDSNTETDDNLKTLHLSPLGRQRSGSDGGLSVDGLSVDGGNSLQGSVQSPNKLDADIEQGKKFKDFDLHELDDGLGSLTADEYVKIRLTPLIASLSTKAPPMNQLNTVVTLSTIFLSVTSSGTLL